MNVSKCSTTPVVASEYPLDFNTIRKSEGVYIPEQMKASRLVIIGIGSVQVILFYEPSINRLEPCYAPAWTGYKYRKSNETVIFDLKKA